MSDRESIIAYIELQASKHDTAAEKPGNRDASYNRGTATMYRALASNIRAGLDRA